MTADSFLRKFGFKINDHVSLFAKTKFSELLDVKSTKFKILVFRKNKELEFDFSIKDNAGKYKSIFFN